MAKNLLKLAALASFGVALLHIVIIMVGAPGYRYFGAGEEMAQMAEAGSPVPGLVTFGIAVVFAIWGLYGLSGAGTLRRLPLLPLGLVVISGIYSLRGLALLLEIYLVISTPNSIPGQELAFSGVSLLVGLLYGAGTALNWRGIRSQNQKKE